MTDPLTQWTIYVCPECNTVYADPSNVCECKLPEGVQPETVEVVSTEMVRGVAERVDDLEARWKALDDEAREFNARMHEVQAENQSLRLELELRSSP